MVPPGKDDVNKTYLRAPPGPEPVPGQARIAEPAHQPETPGLTQDEIRQLILELIG